MATTSVTSERTIPASPEAIFAVLADPGRHSEIDGSGTVVGSSGSGERLALGSQFGMSMKMGGKYSTTNTVVEFEEGRRIAWQTRPNIPLVKLFVGGRIWRYELEPSGDGTRVRETWDISQEKTKLVVKPFVKKVGPDMDATLERLEAAAKG